MAALAGKRIGLLTARASRANGGVFEAVVGQVGLLKRLGAVPVVIAVEDEAHVADAWRLDDAEVRLAKQVGPDQPGFAPQLAIQLKEAKLDLLHLHGIWTYASRAAAHWANNSGGPLVISPHGMLDPWITERNRWKKNLARFAWERDAWKSATAFHALTQDEAADIRREAGGAEIGVIPNPAPKPSPPRERIAPPMALYLGRIHEKKNLIALMEGWLAALPDLPPDASLTIAGWGDEEGVAALERFLEPVGPSIQFIGAAFGSQKAALFDVARFTVLPSLSEGLPMAMLDSWAAGVPTVMSNACHLPDGYDAGAALRCGTDKASIARALVSGFALDEPEWLSRSQSAQALASGPFGPEEVAGQWEQLYGNFLKG
ncbi:glycosyltransferase [Qipengyuania sp. XHP0211]|uniref:glycosyltransferase n=1 Tax=Qipengyuania sp. XHP0211 TaxID=3038079 RepID=UPI00241C66C4|nr:glycosyltransferase [Qipengyuania sp. XHP0211]MDG5750638.1 glycosyltransferase [Qipengyuania sp. XHP0211]